MHLQFRNIDVSGPQVPKNQQTQILSISPQILNINPDSSFLFKKRIYQCGDQPYLPLQ